jgi:AraC-like DNA-binding protein
MKMSPSSMVASLQQHPVNEGHLRVGPLVEIPGVLQERGISPVEITDSINLNVTLLSNPENMIPFSTVGRLLDRCAARTGYPHFGMLIGQRSGPDCMGLVGRLSLQMPDVGSALRNLIFHLHLHDRGAAPFLSVEGDVAMFGYSIYHPRTEGSSQIYDGAIAIAFNTMRVLCGPAWRPAEVLFSHRQPDDIRPYRHFFQASLSFDREQTALVFPAKWLDHAVPGADPLLRQQLEQRIIALENLEPRDLIGQVRSLLRNLLLTNRCSLEQVAQLFSMHRRTLNRRLEEQNCTFQGLVDEIRFEIACQLLENTHMSMSNIAVTLDYSDASSFTRAFRRWSGMAPTAWRSLHPANLATDSTDLV